MRLRELTADWSKRIVQRGEFIWHISFVELNEINECLCYCLTILAPHNNTIKVMQIQRRVLSINIRRL